eukprot:scaffold3164_cov112-Isochrysis_galbana.AAC.3
MLQRQHQRAKLLQVLDGDVAVDGRGDRRASEGRTLATHAQEDGATGLPEAIIHKECLLPSSWLFGEVIEILGEEAWRWKPRRERPRAQRRTPAAKRAHHRRLRAAVDGRHRDRHAQK